MENRQLPSTIIDLGTLAAGGISIATAMNDQGQVVGYASASSGYYPINAFLWDAQDGMQDLGTLEEAGYSSATGINDRGQVVGAAATSSDYHPNHAFLWDARNGIQDLGTLGGQYSDATGINNRGQVVGYSSVSPTYPTDHAFLWDHRHGMQDLGTLGGDTSAADAINNRGQVVGSAALSGNAGGHVFLWDRRHGMQDLGFAASPADLNNVGQIVGTLYTSPSEHAFLWDAQHGVQDLGTLGSADAIATGINDAGQVVGYSRNHLPPYQPYNAFLYSDGVMTDLNDLLPPHSGWRLIEARAINDAGQIVGYGVPDNSGQNHAFLLTLDDADRPHLASSFSSPGMERIALAGPFGEDPGAAIARLGGSAAAAGQPDQSLAGQEPVAEVAESPVPPGPRQRPTAALLPQQRSNAGDGPLNDFGDADADVDFLSSRS